MTAVERRLREFGLVAIVAAAAAVGLQSQHHHRRRIHNRPAEPEAAPPLAVGREPLWRSNFSLLVTGAVFVCFVVKVYAVTRGDLATALAVLEAVGPAQVLLGVAMRTGIPSAIGMLAGAALGVLIATDHDTDLHRRGLFGSIAIALAAALLYNALGGLVLLALVLVYELAARRGWRMLDPESGSDGFDWKAYVFGFLVPVSFFVSDSMWLPTHRIETPDGPQAAYILRESETHLTVLRDAPRDVRTLTRSDVEDLGLCSGEAPDWWERSGIGLTASQEYARCPRPDDGKSNP